MAERALIYGLPVDLVRRTQLETVLLDWLRHPGISRQVVTLNVNMLMLAQKDAQLRRTIREAGLVTADGYGIVRALQRRCYHTDRITGLELARHFLQIAAREGYPVFFYGGNLRVCHQLLERLPLSYPGLKIQAARDGYEIGCPVRTIRRELRDAPPRFLLAGLGTPSQELFLKEVLPLLPNTIGIGVGGVLEILAGMQNPAPQLMQDHGLEWLFRMVQEPRRLNRLPDLARFWWREVTQAHQEGELKEE